MLKTLMTAAVLIFAATSPTIASETDGPYTVNTESQILEVGIDNNDAGRVLDLRLIDTHLVAYRQIGGRPAPETSTLTSVLPIPLDDASANTSGILFMDGKQEKVKDRKAAETVYRNSDADYAIAVFVRNAEEQETDSLIALDVMVLDGARRAYHSAVLREGFPYHSEIGTVMALNREPILTVQ